MLCRIALLILLASLLLAHVSLGQEHQSPFTVSITAGYAFFSPTDLNKLLARLSSPEIKGGLNFSGDVGYYLAEALSLHLTGGFMLGKSSSTIGVTSSAGPQVVANAEQRYTISTLPIGLGAIVHIPLGFFKLGVGAFADWNIAGVEYELDGTAYNQSVATDRKKSQLGGHFYLGPEFGLTRGLSLQLQLGYQAIKISGLDGTSGFFPEKLSVDFSGTYGLAGLRYRF